MDGKWRIRDEKTPYESEWMDLTVYDVELPDGSSRSQHVVHVHKPGAAVVVHEPDKGVLLLWRHRIAVDQWGWEVPAGFVDKGESPAKAAAREVLEETGWRPGPLTELATVGPDNGLIDHRCHQFYAAGATWEGPGPDANEAADVAWVPLDKVREILRAGEMHDGVSVTALLWAMTLGPLAPKA